jgi:hypothetical protein
MKPAELTRAAALLPALLLCGCLWVSAGGSFGPNLSPEVVGQLHPGETTKAEVLALLGPPEEFIRSEVLGALGDETTRVTGAVALGNRAQDAFTYQHDRVWARGHVLLLYNHARARVDSDILVIFFDEQDRVREVGFRKVTGSREKAR